MTTAFEDEVIKSTLQFLSSMEELPTTKKIYDLVEGFVHMVRLTNSLPNMEEVDKDLLVRKIEAACNVYVPAISTLDDQSDHVEWFSDRRAELPWRFWERYKMYLKNNPQLPPSVIRQLEAATDQILRRLEDPARSGTWDRRGLVVGQVQSGKTSNYTALVCKAADVGYKLIIVLAGVHNSLRSQTQLRLDEGFLGFDTQQRRLFDPNNIRLGVGLLRGMVLYNVNSLTNSHENGDFSLKVARQSNITIYGADPILLVVKKNASVLKNLLQWCTRLASDEQDNTHGVIHSVPLLLIDDEADSASINTNPIRDEDGNLDSDLDPSKINGLIRTLLKSFSQSAYVGYTATPFANIFISDKMNEGKYGQDLFPRSFIINLQPPSNYVGPARLFGLTPSLVNDEDDLPGLPLIRQVKDYQPWIPDRHKKEHADKLGPLPPSVQEAIKAFILTCAIRYARGQTRVHNSMLIHVTRFTAVQSAVFNQVRDELDFAQNRLRYGDGDAPRQILAELKDLWDKDFEPTMKMFDEPDLTPVTWEQVKEVLYTTTSKIEIRKINGTASDALQYETHKEKGLSVICIGGDKLSRGLTLEGLSISYYLRASKMYDTLMQMGRWFGYRNGYVDLCRLYTTSELKNWYRDITSADEELRQMFENMADQERTPQDYGLGVRTHPDELIITSTSKMRTGQKVRLSYSEDISETVAFYTDSVINRQNLQVTEQLIQKIKASYPQRPTDTNYIWDGVDGDTIIEFLSEYKTHQAARKAQSAMLTKYIGSRITDGELINWTVALISIEKNMQGDDPTSSHHLADLTIGLTTRQRISDDTDPRYSIRRLLSPKDETLDLSPEEYDQALEKTKKRLQQNPDKIKDADKSKQEPERPSGVVIREMRPATRGLLLLYLLKYSAKEERTGPTDQHVPIVGFGISFPKSNHGDDAAVEYVVNETYWQQELGDEL